LKYLKTFILPAIIFLVLLLSACQPEFDIERDYPLVKTLAVDNITSDGARFNGHVIYGPVESITEYGFVWGNSVVLNIQDSDKISLEGYPTTGDFSCDIMQRLVKMQKYFVRSYIRFGDLVVYGNLVTFVTSDVSIITNNKLYHDSP
jgi:hypothetical protein